jgi:hypothetical protein
MIINKEIEMHHRLVQLLYHTDSRRMYDATASFCLPELASPSHLLSRSIDYVTP